MLIYSVAMSSSNFNNNPELGFCTFLIGTMISLGLSHLVLPCHRLIVERTVLHPWWINPRESLAVIESSPVSDAQEKVLCIKFTYFGKIFVGTMIVFGYFYYAMGFECKGLVGLMLKDKAQIDGNSIPKHSGTTNQDKQLPFPVLGPSLTSYFTWSSNKLVRSRWMQ